MQFLDEGERTLTPTIIVINWEIVSFRDAFFLNFLPFCHFGSQRSQPYIIIPLFLNKAELLKSYTRLIESPYKQLKYAKNPKIQVTTLKDVLFSMERGTIPHLQEMEFYTSESDRICAKDMMSPILPWICILCDELVCG